MLMYAVSRPYRKAPTPGSCFILAVASFSFGEQLGRAWGQPRGILASDGAASGESPRESTHDPYVSTSISKSKANPANSRRPNPLRGKKNNVQYQFLAD